MDNHTSVKDDKKVDDYIKVIRPLAVIVYSVGFIPTVLSVPIDPSSFYKYAQFSVISFSLMMVIKNGWFMNENQRELLEKKIYDNPIVFSLTARDIIDILLSVVIFYILAWCGVFGDKF